MDGWMDGWLRIAHGKVMLAMQLGNYHDFFQLYEVCPNMGGYLMDLLVGMMRHLGLRQISKGGSTH